MKFLHLADLHLGKKLNDFSMIEEQKFVLSQICKCITEKEIDSVLISGDVFDKPIPSIEALEIFSDFLNFISSNNKTVFIISGNHDSEFRLSNYSKILEKSNIFISKPFNGVVEKIKFDKETNIFLLPCLNIFQIKRAFPDEKITSFNEAFEILIKNTKINENEINILLAHQFISGSDLILSDSEQNSVGGVDEVNYSCLQKFDYCALGHLHCPQKIGMDKIRYAGSILKYSLSEINQKKSLCIFEINKNKELKFEFYPIKFIHEMKQYRGKIDKFLSEEFYNSIDVNDYIHFILEDDEVIEAKKKLSIIYPNIIQLEFDNVFTRNLNNSFESMISVDKSLFEHFSDFYKIQTNDELSCEDIAVLREILNEAGEEKCVH